VDHPQLHRGRGPPQPRNRPPAFAEASVAPSRDEILDNARAVGRRLEELSFRAPGEAHWFAANGQAAPPWSLTLAGLAPSRPASCSASARSARPRLSKVLRGASATLVKTRTRCRQGGRRYRTDECRRRG
jgi:hypothetical protein